MNLSPSHPLYPVLSDLVSRARARLSREDGQGGIEYFGVVIAAALIVLAIVAAASGIGGDIVEEIQSKVEEITNGGGPGDTSDDA